MKRVNGLIVVKRAMGLLLSMFLAMSLASCGLITTNADQNAGLQSPQSLEQGDGATEGGGEQGETLAQLVLSRQQLCLLPDDMRMQMLDNYRAVFVQQSVDSRSLPASESETQHKLKALMLATCHPARTPGVLREMLAMITQGHWPAEYVAFFDVLIASHRAYVLVDDKHRDVLEQHRELQERYQALQQEHQALRTEHENTIRGISDIERGIDLPNGDFGL